MIVTIKKIGINGEGIGYYKKKALFIDGCLPEEVVEFEIIKEHPNYIEAKALKILKKSKERIEPSCRYYRFCGGCQLMHTNYQNQLTIKRDLFIQTLSKYTKINAKVVSEIVPSQHEFHYRHELKLPVTSFNNTLHVGMYMKKTNQIKRIHHCIIHQDELESVKDKVLAALNKKHVQAYNGKQRDGLRYILLRGFQGKYQLHLLFGEKNNQEKLVGDLKKIDELSSIYFSYNTKSDPLIHKSDAKKLYGDEEVFLDIGLFRFAVKQDSFLQLNLKQAETIFNYINSLIKPCNLLVETYAGIGMMSILFHQKAKRIFASELNQKSIASFKRNITLNSIENIEVKVSDAYQHLREIDESIDYLIVDPPRSGLDYKMIEEILKKDIKNIIYMSCSASSLCKNLELLKSKYKIKHIQLFDMFTNTAHVESVALLERK